MLTTDSEHQLMAELLSIAEKNAIDFLFGDERPLLESHRKGGNLYMLTPSSSMCT